MLPFLQKKSAGGVTTQVRKSDNPDKYDSKAPLKSCAQDFIDGVHANDVQKVASAFRAAFEILDSEPHVEGPHLDDEGDSE